MLNKTKHHFSKPFLIFLACFVIFIAIFIPIQQLLLRTAPATTYNSKSIKNTKEEKGFAEKFIDVTPEQGKKIDNVLKKCGLENASSLQPDKSLNSRHKGKTAYVLTVGDINNIFVFLDKKKNVYIITYKNNKLYAKNKVKSTLSDYIPTTDEKVDWMYYCQDQVKTMLVSPSTASFPSIFSWAFTKEKSKLTISSYVDSENLYGAEIRAEFQFEINLKKNQVTSFILDGEKLI